MNRFSVSRLVERLVYENRDLNILIHVEIVIYSPPVWSRGNSFHPYEDNGVIHSLMYISDSSRGLSRFFVLIFGQIFSL